VCSLLPAAGQQSYSEEPGIQQGGQHSSTSAGASSQGTAAAGVTPSPQPRYSAAAAAAAAAGLVSPGQRRRREESEDASDHQGLRPHSVEPYSRDSRPSDGGLDTEDEGGCEWYGSIKRLRASQEGSVAGFLSPPGASQGLPSSQQGVSQQQTAAGAGGGSSTGMGGWLTSPCSSATAAPTAGLGLSISVGGPLQQGFGWSPSAQGMAPVGTGARPSSSGMLLPPQPPLFQPPKQQQQQEYGAGFMGPGPFVQQQHGRVGDAFEPEAPAVMMQLTPPDQMVAAMQQQPLQPPGSSAGSTSHRQRRPIAAAAAVGASDPGSARGPAGTPPCSQSPSVLTGGVSAGAAAGVCGSSPQVVTTGQVVPSSSSTRGCGSSEDARQQQQQQLSAAGRPIRQQSRRAVSAAAAAAARLDSYDRDSGPVSYAGGVRFLQVGTGDADANQNLGRVFLLGLLSAGGPGVLVTRTLDV
jgi:hypothetical protein